MTDVPQTGRRAKAARGTVVNSAFLVGLNLLGVVKGFAVAGFVTLADYGVWGLLIVAFTALFGIVQIGVNDKYIQQDREDQENAFQLAFTLQLGVSVFFVFLIAAFMPLYAVVYGNSEILLPGWALALAMPASAFQAPLWTFRRRLDFLRQRQLQMFDPIVNIVLTLALAIAGFGYWSFVIGTICGSWAAAIVAMRASPYRLALHYERGTLREYATFSGPLMVQAFFTAVIQFFPVLAAQRSLGTAAVGAIALASNISRYTLKVDQILTSTLYPVICAVKERHELLEEAFLKSNRLGLMWAAPTGLGVVLFAPDLVHFVIGSRWESAIPIIQSLAAVAVINQIAYNWHLFFRAIGRTWPIAAAGFIMAVAVCSITIPMLLTYGLEGYALGLGISATLLIGVRIAFLRRLFSVRMVVANSVRGLAPSFVAVAGTLALRLAAGGGERTEVQAALELALFVVVGAVVTLYSGRSLFNEFREYLRRPEATSNGAPMAPPADPVPSRLA